MNDYGLIESFNSIERAEPKYDTAPNHIMGGGVR